MVDRIRGGGEDESSRLSSAEQKKLYEAEYKRAADLFERTLVEHGKSENPYQKEAFRQVMEQSMSILNDTAYQLKQEGLMRQNKQIEKDFATYKKEGSLVAKEKLESDLEKAKHAVS